MEKKELKRAVRERLFLDYGRNKNVEEMNRDEILHRMDNIFDYMANEMKMDIPGPLRSQVKEELASELFGLGPLQTLLDDPDITEIMINGPDKVYIEKNGKKVLSPVKFEDDHQLRYLVDKMLMPTGRRVDESSPFVDFSLENGSRINVIIPPLSASGTVVTIRKFLIDLNTVEDLVKCGTLDERMAEFLKGCIKARLNIIFSGATGCGKTTTLEVLSSYIDEQERIITIEDALELHLRQDHVVRLLARQANIEGKGEVPIRDLFINTLRMRPTRIILGEIRGREALDYLQALNSGHKGSLAVIHASSPEDVLTRLETMVFYSNINLPIWAVRRQISQGLDLIVQQEQLVDGSRKITRISEVGNMDENNNIAIKDIFVYEKSGVKQNKAQGKFKALDYVPDFLYRFEQEGISLDRSIFNQG